MDWVKVGSIIGEGVKAIINSAARNQQNFEKKVNKTYSKVQNLSDADLERKVKNAYNQGNDDVESRIMYREYIDRNQRK